MELPECIRLPSLHGYGEAPALAGEMRLWPGHGPAVSGAWTPPAYPLSERDARAFLDQLDLLSAGDLETIRHALSRNGIAAGMDLRDEMADLLEFAGLAPGPRALALARIQAQRLLLWRWRWEERLAEISELEQLCEQALQRLPRELDGLEETTPPAGVQSPLRCAWQPVVANAAFFLPPELPLLAADEMAVDLAEYLDFTDAGAVFRAVAPLWRALGQSRPAQGPASEIYNCERTWLITANPDSADGRNE